ncbi:MAG: ParB/RepB/Spo0J family partition protein [Bacteroidaceae bacterium]|nr:ParB/RepB/Spo0J family partition protein [Bacteroidaceae bacterium]
MAIQKRYSNLGGDKTGKILGRGLDALISTEMPDSEGSSMISEIDISRIFPNPDQPRRDFEENSLAELAASIKEIGIIQPITLRERDGNSYEIIAGERRWRAAQKAGLTSVPAYIRTVSDETMMEMALVENIQRQDLNAIEIALAYQHLQNATGMTQDEVAQRVGKSRAQVANFMRLLRLPAEVQMSLQTKEIDMGHARALLGLESPSEQVRIFREIKKNNYTTRQVENLVNAIKKGGASSTGKKAAGNPKLSETENTLQKRLSSALGGIKVKVSCTSSQSGKVTIPYKTLAELETILKHLEE